MKKRLPILISFVLFLALVASSTFWGLQLMKAKARPYEAPPKPPQQEADIEKAATLFGGKLQAATAANYQVKGVISAKSGHGGTVVINTEGQPLQTLGVGGEVAPGVTIKEIHAQFVMLSDNGIEKRLPVPEAKPGAPSEGILSVQADPNASRMTGPSLPQQQPMVVPQQVQAPVEPPQPPVSPQQIQAPQAAPQPGQPPIPPQPGGAGLGPNGEQLGAPPATRHNK